MSEHLFAIEGKVSGKLVGTLQVESITLTENLKAQWSRFKIVDAYNQTVFSDNPMVINRYRIVTPDGSEHDGCTLLLKPQEGYYNFLDFVGALHGIAIVELIVGIGHAKCNMVYAGKGDHPVNIYLDNQLIGETERMNPGDLVLPDGKMKMYGKTSARDFQKRPGDP